jgi:hypothetical protein
MEDVARKGVDRARKGEIRANKGRVDKKSWKTELGRLTIDLGIGKIELIELGRRDRVRNREDSFRKEDDRARKGEHRARKERWSHIVMERLGLRRRRFELGRGTLIEKGMGNSRLYDGCNRLNVLCDGTPFLTP